MTNMKEFVGSKGTTENEFQRTVDGSIRELPGSFEQAGDVLGAMQRNDLFGRTDNYYDSAASRFRAMTRAGMDSAMRAVLKPDQFIWVVVGDEKIVKPQLEKLGLPVEQGQVAGSN